MDAKVKTKQLKMAANIWSHHFLWYNDRYQLDLWGHLGGFNYLVVPCAKFNISIVSVILVFASLPLLLCVYVRKPKALFKVATSL